MSVLVYTREREVLRVHQTVLSLGVYQGKRSVPCTPNICQFGCIPGKEKCSVYTKQFSVWVYTRERDVFRVHQTVLSLGVYQGKRSVPCTPNSSQFGCIPGKEMCSVYTKQFSVWVYTRERDVFRVHQTVLSLGVYQGKRSVPCTPNSSQFGCIPGKEMCSVYTKQFSVWVYTRERDVFRVHHTVLDTLPSSLQVTHPTRGRYHGGRRPSSDDSFHSPTVIPPSALDKPSIMKHYHRRRMTRRGVTARSPTMVTLHDTGFAECRWWNDGWTVKAVVT